MDLYKAILSHILCQEQIQITFPNLEFDLNKIFESKCYNVLNQIKEIVEDETLNDPECFEKIEKIICIFEELGYKEGSRHDFG